MLSMDNVALMGLSPSHVWFSVSRPVEDLTETAEHPFLMMAQYDHAVGLIVLPMDMFHK